MGRAVLLCDNEGGALGLLSASPRVCSMGTWISSWAGHLWGDNSIKSLGFHNNKSSNKKNPEGVGESNLEKEKKKRYQELIVNVTLSTEL